MRIYIGFDDTDTVDADRGTGKLARWFENKLPKGCRMWGVVRQQLPQMEGIPFTSHNSSACVIVDTEESSIVERLIELGTTHILEHFMEGSDPGLCVAAEGNGNLSDLVQFGRTCCNRIVSQTEALSAAASVHLSGHGGTNDGIIGAAAAVGLTLHGWSGRFIEYGRLRNYPDTVTVDDLEKEGIRILPLERNAMVPALDDRIHTHNWLRPRLWGSRPVLPVQALSPGKWLAVGKKNSESHI